MLPQFSEYPAAKSRFMREARSQAKVEHDHIITIHSVADERGTPYLVMPLLKGQTLADYLKATAPLPAAEILRLGREFAEALTAAHAAGLIHRDVKLGNIWLEGDRRRVKVLDFGLARASGETVGDSSTASGQFIGTPGYVSPEQARGATVDPRTDLFSLGVILYQMVAGRLPFKSEDLMGALTSLVVDTPLPFSASQLPPELVDLIFQLLAKDPDGRPQSAAAVASTLAKIEAAMLTPIVMSPPTSVWNEFDTDAPPPDSAPPTNRSRSRFPVVLVGIALLVLLLGGALVTWQAIRTTTPKGTLVIDSSDPDVEIVVKKNGAVIIDKSKQREIVLVVGDDYTIELVEPKGGLKLITTSFEITKDGKTTVKARVEKEKSVGNVDPNSTFFLSFEGRLRTEAGKEPLSSPGKATYVPGVVGQAARFDADSKALYPTAGNLSTTAGTLEFWVRPDWDAAKSPIRSFVTVGLFPSNTFDVGFDSFDSTLRFSVSGDNPTTTKVETNYYGEHPKAKIGWKSGEWHHVAVTWDNTAHRRALYLDGQLAQAEENAPVMNEFSTRDMIVGGGREASNPRPSESTFDEFRISKRAKTAKEIASAYTSKRPGNAISALQKSALENVLAIKGAIRLLDDITVEPGTKLPTRPFAVQDIILDAGGRLCDADVERLSDLPEVLGVLAVGDFDFTNLGLEKLTRIPGLSQIKQLYIKNTGVTDDGMKSVAKFTQLSDIAASGIKLNDSGLEHLKGLKSLRNLGIAETQVTEAAVNALSEALPECRIQWNGGVVGPKKTQVSTEQDQKAALEKVFEFKGRLRLLIKDRSESHTLDAGKPFPKTPYIVQEIYLNEGAQFRDTDVDQLRDLPYVAGSIEVSDRKFTNVGLEKLTRILELARIHGLSIIETGVNDEGLKHLAKFEDLEYFNAHGSAITDAGLEHLKKLKGLTYISVASTEVTEAGANALAAALPACRIRWNKAVIDPKK